MGARTLQTDDRRHTDGRVHNSELEREFTFAKNAVDYSNAAPAAGSGVKLNSVSEKNPLRSYLQLRSRSRRPTQVRPLLADILTKLLKLKLNT